MAGSGDPIEFGAAIILRYTPFGSDRAFLFEFEENWVKRSMVDGQQVVAGLLDAPRDAISVLGTHGIERFEDHESECALPDIGLCSHIGCPNEYGRFLVGMQ